MGSYDLLMTTAAKRNRADFQVEADDAKAAIIETIAAKCRTHIDLLNARDWASPAWQDLLEDHYLDPPASNHPSIDANTGTQDGYIELSRAFASANPSFKVELVTLEVVVDDGMEEATAWGFTRSTGWGPGVEKEAVNCVKYRKRCGDVWRAWMHRTIRGPGWMGP